MKGMKGVWQCMAGSLKQIYRLTDSGIPILLDEFAFSRGQCCRLSTLRARDAFRQIGNSIPAETTLSACEPLLASADCPVKPLKYKCSDDDKSLNPERSHDEEASEMKDAGKIER